MCPGAGALTDNVATLMARGQAAVEAIQQAPSATTNAVQVADAFQELQLIRELLDAANSRQYERALQVGVKCLQCMHCVHRFMTTACGCLRAVVAGWRTHG